MSAACGMKFEIMEQRKLNRPFFSCTAAHMPQSKIIKDSFKVKSTEIENTGFQPIQKEISGGKGRKRKRKIQGGKGSTIESRYQYDSSVKQNLLENEFCNDSNSDEEEEKKKKDEKVAWEGPDLTKPAHVADLEEIIKSLKDVMVLFDHGETAIGVKSDQQFYKWLEEYCRLRHLAKKVDDDAIFYRN